MQRTHEGEDSSENGDGANNNDEEDEEESGNTPITGQPVPAAAAAADAFSAGTSAGAGGDQNERYTVMVSPVSPLPDDQSERSVGRSLGSVGHVPPWGWLVVGWSLACNLVPLTAGKVLALCADNLR